MGKDILRWSGLFERKRRWSLSFRPVLTTRRHMRAVPDLSQTAPEALLAAAGFFLGSTRIAALPCRVKTWWQTDRRGISVSRQQSARVSLQRKEADIKTPTAVEATWRRLTQQPSSRVPASSAKRAAVWTAAGVSWEAAASERRAALRGRLATRRCSAGIRTAVLAYTWEEKLRGLGHTHTSLSNGEHLVIRMGSCFWIRKGSALPGVCYSSGCGEARGCRHASAHAEQEAWTHTAPFLVSCWW